MEENTDSQDGMPATANEDLQIVESNETHAETGILQLEDDGTQLENIQRLKTNKSRTKSKFTSARRNLPQILIRIRICATYCLFLTKKMCRQSENSVLLKET